MATLRQLLASLPFMCLLLTARSDFAADRDECADQLVGLATCITYVEGTAKAPTPDCCTGFKQVVGKSLKCVCVLVKDRDEPELGIKLNVTLALRLPHRCSAPLNISDCPRLLKLPKDSAYNKMYENFAKELEENDAPTSSPSSTSTEKEKPSSKSVQANGAEIKQLTGYKMVIRVSWIFQVLPLLVLFLV